MVTVKLRYPGILLFLGSSLHWVLRPDHVTRIGVAKPKSGRLIKWIFAWFNDQVVAKTNADFALLGTAISKGVDGHYFAT